MAMPSKSELLSLDVAARLELIGELWDSIARDEAAASQVPVSDAERHMLDERLREYRENPEAGLPWEQVRAELQKLR